MHLKKFVEDLKEFSREWRSEMARNSKNAWKYNMLIETPVFGWVSCILLSKIVYIVKKDRCRIWILLTLRLTKTTFRYSLTLQKIYSLCHIYSRFLILFSTRISERSLNKSCFISVINFLQLSYRIFFS